MALRTRFTEMTGVQHPVMQGGMMWVGRAEAAAAVSNAGGLGTLTAHTQTTPEGLSREIKCCWQMTDKPFASNPTILRPVNPPPYAAYRQAIYDAGVKIVETSADKPRQQVEAFKAAGILAIHKCWSVPGENGSA